MNESLYKCSFSKCSCFLSHFGAFWGAFFGPILVILLFNIVLFVGVITVLIKHVRERSLRTKAKDSSNLKTIVRTSCSIFGLIFLFGLSWPLAILPFDSSAIGLKETFQLLFSVLNSLQGLFIFLFTCVLSSEARDGWKSLLCTRN